MSKIYLIINFRNFQKTIKKCFESLIKQDYKNTHFILFDKTISIKIFLLKILKKLNSTLQEYG